MKNSAISWTTHTWNPWRGCTKVSPGCANCYAESLSLRTGHGHYRKGEARERMSPAYWRQPYKWAKEARESGVTTRVFVASLSDWLDDEVPIEWLADAVVTMFCTLPLGYLCLTKRPENFIPRFEAIYGLPSTLENEDRRQVAAMFLEGGLTSHVAVGVSVENQDLSDKRREAFRAIPAVQKFVSYEPALGPVDWRGWEFVNQIIYGGESGPRARPADLQWARNTRDFCRANGIAFFMKQIGGVRDKQHDIDQFPDDLKIQEFMP